MGFESQADLFVESSSLVSQYGERSKNDVVRQVGGSPVPDLCGELQRGTTESWRVQDVLCRMGWEYNGDTYYGIHNYNGYTPDYCNPLWDKITPYVVIDEYMGLFYPIYSAFTFPDQVVCVCMCVCVILSGNLA